MGPGKLPISQDNMYCRGLDDMGWSGLVWGWTSVRMDEHLQMQERALSEPRKPSVSRTSAAVRYLIFLSSWKLLGPLSPLQLLFIQLRAQQESLFSQALTFPLSLSWTPYCDAFVPTQPLKAVTGVGDDLHIVESTVSLRSSSLWPRSSIYSGWSAPSPCTVPGHHPLPSPSFCTGWPFSGKK